MTKSKKDRKKEFNQMLDQAKGRFKKFGEELGVLAKKSEKEIRKASKVGKLQLDIMSLGVQREKLYYDIGKRVVSLNAKKSLAIPELDSYWKKLESLDKGSRKKKEILALARKKARKKEDIT